MKSKVVFGSMFALLILALLIGGLAGAPPVEALEPCSSFSVDGSDAEWTNADRVEMLWKAGRPDHPNPEHVGWAYLRTCANVSFVAVKLFPQYTLDRTSNYYEDNWFEIDGAKIADASMVNFAYWTPTVDNGWEASFVTRSGVYSWHASYNGGETAATVGRPTALTLVSFEANVKQSWLEELWTRLN